MNYLGIYERLIHSAKSDLRKKSDKYYERHHIIPKCIGGADEEYNLVLLTAEEHYIAHQLLVKIHPGKGKLIFALNMMGVTSDKHRRNNKEYGWIKRKVAKELSDSQKGKSYGYKFKPGKDHLLYGKPAANRGVPHDAATKLKMSYYANNRPESHNRKISESCKGRIVSDETKEKISNRVSGIGNPMYGKEHTIETKLKMSVRAKNRKKTECEYCGKYNIPHLHSRWHGANCKHKEK